MLGNSVDHEVLFEDEFKLRSDLDFLDYKIIDNYGEPYMRKKLIRDLSRQVYNFITGPEGSIDEHLQTLIKYGTKGLTTEIAREVHKEMGSNILNDKIENVFEVYNNKAQSDING